MKLNRNENDLCCKFKNNFHGNGGHIEISKPQKVVIHLCVKFSVFTVSLATTGILKFPSLKTIYTHAIQHFY
jgi:hypothetical protein